ncbi:hypothetical protein RJ640_001650 [Escallonia rubra]|uniref:Uncharacterized protein n=1 Tax=Escallonia rubra TaxID=112253 RepID=A0AA88UCG5_9ASTE|nr:hypothetical protein RJ640_001650 [Escallonia rubra]
MGYILNFNTFSKLRKVPSMWFKKSLEKNPGYNPGSIAHRRTRQASRRMSTELTSVSGHQLGGLVQRKGSNENFAPTKYFYR